MTFNTAIFDVHPGDRRQLERILAKEKPLLEAEGSTVYSESFGSTGSMLIAPMKYDLFIVDAAEDDDPDGAATNLEVARAIRAAGAIAPVVLLFREGVKMPEECDMADVILFQKPTTTAFIHEVLTSWIKEKATRTPRYELRGDTVTYYVYAREVMYALALENSVDVYLTEGRYLHILEPMSYIYKMFEKDLSLVKVGRNALMNMHHIVSAEGNSFKMADDHRITCSIFEYGKLKKTWQRFIAL